ncbi:MAG: hypothetical protein H6907_11780 [Hyphomicrobiales bacterium]|nr:hypothetical protein [Hyphomicrobiales bacterium]MCP5372401.1 hypothetical protein [Hyphomicrobiales bacterium]
MLARLPTAFMCLALSLLLAHPAPARADSFVVGVEDTRYFPHYTFENGAYGGFAREILDAFFAAHGHTVEYRALPVQRLFKTFLDGGVDFKYPDSPRWKPDQKAGHAVRYSRPVVSYVDGVSVPPRALGRGIDRVASLSTVRGFTPAGWLDRIAAGRVALRESDSFRGVVEQAIIGRVDGAYANVDVTRDTVDRVLGKPGALVFDPDLPFERGRYHLSTLRHPGILDQFDAWLAREADRVAALKRKYRVGGAAPTAEVFVVGVEDNRYLPHYAYLDGEYRGFGRAILDAFFQAKGYPYRYRALPVARLFRSFVWGEVDFKYPDNALWSKELKEGKGVIYSLPITSTTDGVSVRPENRGRGLDSFRVLGTVRGFTAWSWIEHVKSGRVVLSENDSTLRLIRQAMIGRVDGAFANVDVIQYLLAHELKKPGGLVFDPSLPFTRSHYHLSSIKHPRIIEEFNEWAKSNGDLINGLKKKFGIRIE